MPANHSTEPGAPLIPLKPVEPVRRSWIDAAQAEGQRHVEEVDAEG